MKNEIILLSFAIFCSIISILHIKKNRMSPGGLILLLYSFCAWGSYLYYKTGSALLFNSSIELTVEPFVYIIIVLSFFFYPVLKFRTVNYNDIEIIDRRIFIRLVKILFMVELLLIIAFIPSLSQAMSGNIGDNRNLIYEGGNFITINNPLILYAFRIMGGLRQLNIVIAIYGFLFYRKERIMKWFLVLSFIYPIFVSLIYVMRSQILLILVFVAYITYIFKPFISIKMWKKYMRIGLLSSVLGFLLIQIISISRFGDLVWTFFLRYWGESFINFNNLLYGQLHGNTHGTAYFPTIFKIFGLKAIDSNIEKYEMIERVCGIDGGIFYTFVGNLCIEYGEIITLCISLTLCLISIKLLKSRDSTLRLSQLLLIGFLGWQFIGGLFTCVFQGDNGNWELIFVILLSIYFDKQKHSTIKINN